MTAARQLPLIEPPARPWKLSELTRELGRQGIASARAELAKHKPKEGP